jgi:hypothetical protein
LVKSSGFVAQIKRDPKYQQSPKIPYLISPGLILSLYILGSPSGSLYRDVSLAGNSESPKSASFSAQISIILLILSSIGSSYYLC